MTEQSTYLTTAGLDKLKAELTDLKENRRTDVLRRIKEAVAYGDLSENSEYEEAKNEQAFVEGRIAQLQKMLENSTILRSNSGEGGKATLGTSVTVKQNGKRSVFTIVGPAEADPDGGLISNESPIGQALLGKAAGEKAVVETPKGNIVYDVISIGKK